MIFISSSFTKSKRFELEVERVETHYAPEYVAVRVEGKDGTVTLMVTPEQMLQFHHTFGEFVSQHPDLFVKGSLQEKEEITND